MPVGQRACSQRRSQGPRSVLGLLRLGPDSRTLGRKGQAHLLSPLDMPGRGLSMLNLWDFRRRHWKL